MTYAPTAPNPFADGPYLTDGGLETTLIFHYGFDLTHFAAFELLQRADGLAALQRYLVPYLRLAEQHQLHFLLETPTWRANPDWGFKMGYSEEELAQINTDAVTFLQDLKDTLPSNGTHIALSGNIGPRGDGYVAGDQMTSAEAAAYHGPQIRTFSEADVDVVSALTMTYSDEAIGIVRAAREANVPVVISFTVETDGLLPSGETLRAAIEKTDAATNGYATHFMINCAHPTHFNHVLEDDGAWKERIRGIRANASTKSHAELDESETLDTGDKCLMAEGYQALMHLLPDLKVIGGCCGSDHSHLEMICDTLFGEPESATG